MPRLLLPSLCLALAACGLVGCQLWSVADFSQVAARPLIEADTNPVEVGDDVWTRNPDWSLLPRPWGRVPPITDSMPCRWMHVTAGSRNEELRLAGLREDNLPAWNAAILSAQRNPAGAAAFAHVLESLVLTPAEYDIRTLDRVSSRPIVAAVKTVWQARSLAELTDTTRSTRTISVSMRAAAAEAWCLSLSHGTDGPTTAMAPAGRALDCADLPHEVRGELYRGIARSIPPALIPGLPESLRNRGMSPETVALRRAAMEACVIHAANHPHSAADNWPATLSEWAAGAGIQELDPQVRKRFGQWLAVTHHAAALSNLVQQLQDCEGSVREEALVSLGRLGGDEARAELRRQATRSEERVRLFAVRGLAFWGTEDLRLRLRDESPRVREAVAEELGRLQTVDAALALRELLADRNLQVQQAAATAVAEWPDTLAAPVLLHGIIDGTYKTRVTCLHDLRTRTGMGADFPLSGPREERVEAARRLALETGLPQTLLSEMTRRENVTTSVPPSLPVFDLVADMRIVTDSQSLPESPEFHVARQRLQSLRPTDVPAVERFILESPSASPTVLLREILPRVSPVHAALQDLQHSDVFVRRRGAQALTALGEQESLSPLAARELAEHLIHEQDGLVWRSALAAVSQDGTEESARIASLAAQHQFADVRRLACEFAARHRRPQDAGWLLPLFNDADTAVRLAAIEAAGTCPSRGLIDGVQDVEGHELPGLRALLTDADPQIRLTAAVGMSRLGDSTGIDELIRLSYEPAAAARERVIRAMGSTGQSRFVEHLVRLAWTEQHDQVQRAILESLDQLVPTEKRPDGLANLSDFDAKIRVWIAWSQGELSPPPQSS